MWTPAWLSTLRGAPTVRRAWRRSNNSSKAAVRIKRASPKRSWKHELDLRLASDEEKVAANAYGVWVEKKMYGRSFMGVERATFLVSPDGRLARIWRKVSPKGHAVDVLAHVQGANNSAL